MTGDLIAVAAALFWAVASLTIARGTRSGTDNGAFLSILLTAALSAAIWLGSGGPGRIGQAVAAPDGLLWFAASGVLSIFFGRVFLHASLHWLGAVRGGSLKRLGPFFSVLLAVLLLGERLTPAVAIGMLLIFAGFAVLVLEQGWPAAGAPAQPRRINPGFWYGVISALAYAGGNIARKWGLDLLPDPTLGVFLSAVAGALLFLATAVFVRSYRDAVAGTFLSWNPWLLTAGVLASLGQVLFFVALDRSTVTRVTLIVSSEVFITMALAGVLGTARDRLTRPVLLAAVLGFAGTVAIVGSRG